MWLRNLTNRIIETDWESQALSKAINLSLTRTNWSDLCRLLLDQYFQIVREIPFFPVTHEREIDQKSPTALFVNQKVNISLDEKTDDKPNKDQDGLDAQEDTTIPSADNMMIDTEDPQPMEQMVSEAERQGNKKNRKDTEAASHPAVTSAEEAPEVVKPVKNESSNTHNDGDNKTNGKIEHGSNENLDAAQGVTQDNSATAIQDIDKKDKNEHNGPETSDQAAMDTDTENAMDVDGTTQVNGKVGEKRKFEQMDEDENNQNDENEDEGPEITRSSLRYV